MTQIYTDFNQLFLSIPLSILSWLFMTLDSSIPHENIYIKKQKQGDQWHEIG